MASSKPPNGADGLPAYGAKEDAKDETAVLDFDRPRQARVQTPEPEEQQNGGLTPNGPGILGPFDWDDFEARYEKALVEADEQEREILKEAESLAKYFQVWSSAASAYDDERAVKRLQTRQRFVNIAEEKMAQRQQHRRLLMIPAILEAYLHQPFSSLQKRVTMSAVDELPFDIPQITSDELLAFQQSHFSNEAAAEFGHTFTSLPPQATSEHQPCEDWWEEEEDDGLGYYEDGVKRTLTDAQIAIFRHSEIRELRRQQEKQAGSKAPELPQDVSAKDMGTASPQDGGGTVGSQSKKRKRKKPKAVKQEPKPDLRKRTWDVVEAGLDSLDYD
ncbi:hypothetical protein M440DRAFT_1391170 [Trichoderma longibrachiatum ATCC 18648]|uniref:Uncharacterized protein n=1 Tax=Trichoderma longibrachiatum ATCC 18648 TaxID=983965 RepID=A0A2T4C8X4_TRILO|nr:hypothetical protein M440DRAFT_1391170 [Trichoderma longibrachiatum ATCC 18648]